MAHYSASDEPIGGELNETKLREQGIEGTKRLRRALIDAGHISPPTPRPALKPALKPLPAPDQPPPLVQELQEKIELLQAQVEAGERRGIPKFNRPTEIIREISKLHNIPVSAIRGERRDKHVVIARHHAMVRIYAECVHLSLPWIGNLFGARDHTTVLHAVRRWPEKAKKYGLPLYPRRVA